MKLEILKKPYKLGFDRTLTPIRKKKRKKKVWLKYDLFSVIVAVVVLTTLSIGALVLGNFISDFGDNIRTEAQEMEINQTYVNQSTEFIKNDSVAFSDNYVFWFFVATFIGLILTALYLEFEPAIMIILFIFGAIAILGAWLGSNIHAEFAEDTTLSTTSASMPKTQLIMGSPYFPIFIFVGLIVMIVIMYSKKRQGEYQ